MDRVGDRDTKRARERKSERQHLHFHKWNPTLYHNNLFIYKPMYLVLLAGGVDLSLRLLRHLLLLRNLIGHFFTLCKDVDRRCI